ncbi:MAG: radical SAM protein [Candidatus Omnitrophica bacterium]|nr:radical SAM protein [Candidatus Omnitrophota bacterium]
MAYIIKGFNPHTFIDWAGKLASVVYLPGCNFRCPFCHSKALVQEIDTLSDISFDYIEKFLKEKSGWLDSVVIGGGEPTLHADLPELLKKIFNFRRIGRLCGNGYKSAFR